MSFRPVGWDMYSFAGCIPIFFACSKADVDDLPMYGVRAASIRRQHVSSAPAKAEKAAKSMAKMKRNMEASKQDEPMNQVKQRTKKGEVMRVTR